MKTRIGLAVTVLLIASLACSVDLGLPDISLGDGDSGDIVTEDLSVPVPDNLPAQVVLQFGAGQLNISPGGESPLIQGTARYDVDQLKPQLNVRGNDVRLSSGDLDELPNFRLDFDRDITNEWDLELGTAPMTLALQAGAFQGDLELGGLDLRWLSISSGASELSLNFSEPNLGDMGDMRISTGASQTTLSGLANANFERMTFDGGAGEFELDFSGDLQKDARVEISAALSSLTIVIPSDMSARVSVDGALADVRLPDTFERDGEWRVQSGSGPTLTIEIDIGAGELVIRSS